MNDDIQVTGTVADSIRELLKGDASAAREYLAESFLSDAILALFHARRDAGLTQAELANRLHTKQSSVARLERDLSGSVTLRRYVEVALACGKMPFNISLAPVEAIRDFYIDRPDEPCTESAYQAWRNQPSSASETLRIEVSPVVEAPSIPALTPPDNIIVLQGTPQYAQRHGDSINVPPQHVAPAVGRTAFAS